eukprot:m.16313 g.16313  ORF g.16313 m.16313 type:complete len:199 (-) comp4598_c0_seq1:294-890(-)
MAPQSPLRASTQTRLTSLSSSKTFVGFRESTMMKRRGGNEAKAACKANSSRSSSSNDSSSHKQQQKLPQIPKRKQKILKRGTSSPEILPSLQPKPHQERFKRSTSDSVLYVKQKHEDKLSSCLNLVSLVRIVNAKTLNEEFNDRLLHFALQRNVWEHVNNKLKSFKETGAIIQGVVLTQEGEFHDKATCSICRKNYRK